jgi:transposase, IS30 family
MPYHHITREEQYVIAHMTIADFSQREIGRLLGRHHTSIGREIRRNRPTYADDAVYWYDAAEYYGGNFGDVPAIFPSADRA